MGVGVKVKETVGVSVNVRVGVAVATGAPLTVTLAVRELSGERSPADMVPIFGITVPDVALPLT